MAQVADVREGMVVTLDGGRVVYLERGDPHRFPIFLHVAERRQSLQTAANDVKRGGKKLQNRWALVIGWLTSSVERSEDFVEVLDHLTSSR